MKIALGTVSELKIRAAKAALFKLDIKAEIIPLKTPSGIANQPFGIEEISLGAKNRAIGALEQSGADISLGVESGLIKNDELGCWLEVAVAVVYTKDGSTYLAYSTAYPVPTWVVESVRENHSEMGEFIKRINPEAEKDPLKYFSNGYLKREEVLSQAILCAFMEWVNPGKYQQLI